MARRGPGVCAGGLAAKVRYYGAAEYKQMGSMSGLALLFTGLKGAWGAILAVALVVIYGAVAVRTRKLSPTVAGCIGLALGAMFVVFMFNEPDARGRYGDALFAALGIGLGLRRLGSLQRRV